MIVPSIHGGTQLTGIIGDPIGHTLSPAIHNAAFQSLHLPWVYVPFRVKPADLAHAILGLQALNVVGMNVTRPHKEAVLQFVDVLDPLAQQIGAVNTIHLHHGRRYGYNTDAAGFLESLRREGRFNPRGKKAVLLGAGGAARAVASALVQAGVRRLVVVNRDKDRAGLLVRQLRRAFEREVTGIGLDETRAVYGTIREAELLINATSMGMNPRDPALVNPMWLHEGLLVYDLVCRDTPLLQAARKREAKALSGVGMLLHQGAKAFEIWTRKPAPLQVMREALVAAMKEASCP